MGFVETGRDSQVLLPIVFTYRSLTVGYHCFEHGSAYLPSIQAYQGDEDGLGKETEEEGRER